MSGSTEVINSRLMRILSENNSTSIHTKGLKGVWKAYKTKINFLGVNIYIKACSRKLINSF